MIEQAPGYHRRAPEDALDGDLYSRNIIVDGIYRYKGNLYRVNAVLPNNMIQFDDAWWPTVRYTCEPQTEKVFYRSVCEFYHKFNAAP